ncbi:MAG TPA: two-component regulator propeller domain-containing protein [Bacteroidia bacterium]|nr:two-component regulator propeller domain-containing protein [Bacteroidia bacterium]
MVHYTTKEGLANNSVLNVLQDKNGFIWIGTENGLSRFDGYEFLNFFSNQPDSATLSNNHCNVLAEDTSGYIWVSTLHGLNRIDPRTLSVERFYNIIPSNTGKGSTEGYIEKDRKGNIFYRGQHDIMKWNYTQQLFEPFYPDIFNAYRDSTGDIFGIFLDTKERYWIYYRLGLRLLDVNNRKLINAIDPKERINIQDMAEEPGGNFFLATWGHQLLSFDPQTFQKQNLLANDTAWKSNIIMQSLSLVKSSAADHSLFFSINDFAIGKYNFRENTFEKIFFDKLPVFNNNRAIITNVFSDKQKNVWCASDNGLYKIINRQADILNYDFSFLKEQNHEAQIIQRFNNEQTDDLLIRDEKQKLYLYNPGNNEAELLNEIKCSNKTIKLKLVYLYSVDRLNRAWIFTTDNDIICWDKNADTLFTAHYDLGKDLNGYTYYFTSAYTDRKGKIWLTALGGLFYFEEGTIKKFDFSDEKKKYGQQFSQTIKRIKEDENGNLWITRNFSWEGKKAAITKINTSDNTYETFFKDNKPGSISTDNDFFDIAVDNKNKIWIANVNGLITFNASDKKRVFTPVPQETPYNYGMVLKLIFMNDTLVIYSNNGIYLLNTANGKVMRKYDERDGVFSLNELSSVNKLAGSRLMLNYGKNFQVIDLSVHESSSAISKPILVSVKIKENDFVEYKNKAGFAPYIDEIILQPGIRDIIFKFTANDFSDGINRLFTWKLDGFENTWSLPNYSNHTSYNNLEPGNYLFKLKVVDRFGNSGEEFNIPVKVKPFFYQTFWFKILIVLIFVLLVYIFFRYRFRKKLEQQLALQKERERISSDLHDDLGSGLTSIALISEMINNKTAEGKQNTEMQKISGTANELVDNMREIVWALNTKNDSLENLVGYIHEHAQKAFEFSSIKLKVNIPEQIAESQLAAEPRRNIFLTVKETLTNSIRYSEAKNVFLKFYTDKEALKIEIADDGKGFSIDNIRKNANGIKNMKKRMEIIGGRYSVHSIPEKGTVTEIYFIL